MQPLLRLAHMPKTASPDLQHCAETASGFGPVPTPFLSRSYHTAFSSAHLKATIPVLAGQLAPTPSRASRVFPMRVRGAEFCTQLHVSSCILLWSSSAFLLPTLARLIALQPTAKRRPTTGGGLGGVGLGGLARLGGDLGGGCLGDCTCSGKLSLDSRCLRSNREGGLGIGSSVLIRCHPSRKLKNCVSSTSSFLQEPLKPFIVFAVIRPLEVTKVDMLASMVKAVLTEGGLEGALGFGGPGTGCTLSSSAGSSVEYMQNFHSLAPEPDVAQHFLLPLPSSAFLRMYGIVCSFSDLLLPPRRLRRLL
mmetsp:Transcript_26721/g.66954  ORF Transcript_26721/g.66954 Transcript_26721/m.66954 type:complete len:307 (+) Transcript_26721:6997-7917(+)